MQGEESNVKLKVDIGRMLPKLNEHLEPPEPGGGRKDSPLGSVALLTLWFRLSGLQNCESINLCCFK